MKLPKNILTGTYTKPRFFLCEPDKQRICVLETTDTKGNFKFNSYSEITFEVARIYNDAITGEQIINPYYDKIEALRLVEVEGIGYFEIQGPEIVSDGIKEAKSVTAYSLEYTLSQKYLEDFYTVNGRDEWSGSLEDQWQDAHPETPDYVPSIVLYNANDKYASILNLILEKVYGWSIGHVDTSLLNLKRDFDIDRMSVYDFIMNEICAKYNCYAKFDTVENTINLYAEALTTKFSGDGTTKQFTISPAYGHIGSVAVGGYKTDEYTYNISTGVLTFNTAPPNGANIEVTDGALQKYETDVFISFDNLSQEVNVQYDADSIKTSLTVTYGDDENIRDINFGMSYIVDLSYFHTVEWMGQELYDAYTKYNKKCNDNKAAYDKLTQDQVKILNDIERADTKLSLEYSITNAVTETTAGTYYVKNEDGSYREVTLPGDYIPGTTYYSKYTANVHEDKVYDLFNVLKRYYNQTEGGSTYNAENVWTAKFDELSNDFKFTTNPTYSKFKTNLTDVANTTTYPDKEKRLAKKEEYIKEFLKQLWNELGLTPLQELYLDTYKEVQVTNLDMQDSDTNTETNNAGSKAVAIGNWSEPSHPNYWMYYPVTIMISSLETAVADRKAEMDKLEADYQKATEGKQAIAKDLLMANNFTSAQLIRLNAFLREDELHLEDIVTTDNDDEATMLKTKQDALAAGRIELQKLSQPQLQFSMQMANIYALPEFEPIINQFQLGNVIKVGIRSDYIKQSRLLAVNINFDDFSDFSCEFGDLTNLRTQSDIHADLLKNAIEAGKSVATNASYWSKGAEKANTVEMQIQNGLLNAVEAIKNIDGTQSAYIDKYGIHLEKTNSTTGEIDDQRIWMVNNQIVFTDDAWKTAGMAMGKVKLDDETTTMGVIAESLIGNVIVGNKLTIEATGTDPITKKDNTTLFKVDGTGAYLGNASFTMQGPSFTNEDGSVSDGNKLIFDPRYGIVAGDSTIYSVQNSQIKYGFLNSKGEVVFDDTGVMPSGSSFYYDINSGNAAFRGDVYAENGIFHGRIEAEEGYFSGSIDCGDGKFTVSNEGKLTATDADITGDITATNLTIKEGATISGLQIGGGVTLAPGATISWANIANTPYIPNKTSDLYNDSDFATTDQLPDDKTITEIAATYMRTNDIELSGSLWHLLSNGEREKYVGVTPIRDEDDNLDHYSLQLGSNIIDDTSYKHTNIYAGQGGTVNFYPGGKSFSSGDRATLVVGRNSVSVRGTLKVGPDPNNLKKVLTSDDLADNGDIIVDVNNKHFHSGKTLKCVGITPMQENGTTAYGDAFTIGTSTDGFTVAAGRVRPVKDGAYSSGADNYRWSTTYTRTLDVAGDPNNKTNSVIIKNLPTASSNGPNLRIGADGVLYKVSDDYAGGGGTAVFG